MILMMALPDAASLVTYISSISNWSSVEPFSAGVSSLLALFKRYVKAESARMMVIVSATMPKRLMPKASFVRAVDKSNSKFLYWRSLTSWVSVGVMLTLAGIFGGGGISSSSC